jgi:L-ribulose-5-phosphate 3-epimerase
MTRLGIMQGRLVPPEPGRFQAFPRERWEEEFAFAAQVPLSYIEWVYDLYGADVNPLTADIGRIQARIRESGVSVFSMCADYFMDKPFLRCSQAERVERLQFLQRLLPLAKRIGIERIVLPFVDASRIESDEEKAVVIGVLKEALPAAREAGVELHLEADLAPLEFAKLLDQIPDSFIKINYDSGNSSSLGYAPEEEFASYGDRVGSVHIKDRIRGGGTVPLGTGDADFPAVFAALARIGYQRDITLQVARSERGQEVAWARTNRLFVERYWCLAKV